MCLMGGMGIVVVVGLGAQYRLYEGLGARVEYQRYFLDDDGIDMLSVGLSIQLLSPVRTRRPRIRKHQYLAHSPMTPSDSPGTRRSLLTSSLPPASWAPATAGSPKSDVTGVPESASPVFLGDLVWCDLNCDGIRDPGEPGIPQVTVRLIDAVNAVVGADITDAEGIYGIESSIGAGTYRVVVDDRRSMVLLHHRHWSAATFR